jgi:PKD domain/Glucose / Sorbosone dehydrogenase
MSFGNDGLIYLVIGDGSIPSQPQNLKHLFGKLIRVDENGKVPSDNPYTVQSGGTGVPCGKNRGTLPTGAPSNAVCSEIYAHGFRNPFRMSQDINTKNKVRFVIGDVGEAKWEEISEGGTDYKGKNYGWGVIEGPCQRGSLTECPIPGPGFVDPFYYYQHRYGEAVTASVFVPNGLWPEKYKFLFVEYIAGTIFNLMEDVSASCRKCEPPVPAYRNETFHKFGRMVDIFFAPYKNTQAMYYLSREGGLNVRRIRYTNNDNKVPKSIITVPKTEYQINEVVAFDGSKSSDPDGDVLKYLWNFGNGRKASLVNPKVRYSSAGQYVVQLKVTDPSGAISQATKTIVVGVKPSAVMESPAYGEQFAVGQVIRLKGRATDSKNRPIPDSQIFWEVQQKHANHYHPFLDLVAGNNFNLHPAPPPEDYLAAENSFLKVFMHAVDSDGVTTTIPRNIYPKKVSIDIDSKTRRGLKVLTDGFTVITPTTITSWENHTMTLSVSDQGNFVFSSWSIGGGRETKFLVPKASATNPKIVANLRKVVLRQ